MSLNLISSRTLSTTENKRNIYDRYGKEGLSAGGGGGGGGGRRGGKEMTFKIISLPVADNISVIRRLQNMTRIKNKM